MEKTTKSCDIRLAKIYEPIWKHKRIKAFFGGRGGGRGNPVDMIIPTKDGLKRFGDLTMKDMVYGSDGKFQHITGIYDRGMLDTYRVHFSDGSYLDTDPTHIWAFDYTRSKTDKKRRIITTDDILHIQPKDYYRWHLPLVCITEGKKIAVNAYLVGLWLADGSWSVKRAVISKKEPFVKAYLDTTDYKHKRTREDEVSQYTYSTNHNLSLFLQKNVGHKTAKYKFIPDCFFTADYETRKELLHGLMDGDGRLNRRNGRDYVSPQYHTTSEQLAKDVVSLVCSLGGVAKKRIDSDGTIEVNIYLPFNTFKYSHEVNEYSPVKDAKYGHRILSGIEYIGKKEIRCIRVSNEDSLYVADKNFYTLTHNTHNVARYILIRAMREKLRIWCARETQNSIADSVQHVFVELIDLYGLNEYFKITDQDITCLATGSYFMFKGFRGSGSTYSPERLKAYEDFDILWVEEASACIMESLNVVSKTIRKEGSELIFTFNRVLEEDPVWRFACYDVGNDIYTKHVFEDDKRLIIYANADTNEFATSVLFEEREMDRKRLTVDEFNRVWLGYPDRSGGMKAFFTRSQVYGNTVQPPFEETDMWETVVGFDPNGGGKDSACAVARRGREIVEMRVYRDIKDPRDLAERFIMFKHKHGANRAYCDSGYGQGVIVMARIMNENIIPVDFGGKSLMDTCNCLNKRAEMYYKLRDWLQDGGYLGDPKDNEVVELKRELQCIEYNLRKSDDGKIALGPKDDIRKKLGHSPDRADAVALTFAGFKDKMIKNDRGIEIDDSGEYSVQSMDNIDTLDLI